MKRLKSLIWHSDTSIIRLVMAVSSLGYAIGLLPLFHTFDRPAFALMRLLAPESVWVFALLLHSAGVTWRLLDDRASLLWGWLINGLGLALWGLMVFLVLATVGEYSPGMAMEMTVMAFAFIS